ncbi:MAG: MFS transporter [Reyranella sp.]|uniref:MFS transporter n=1 Tax=Reyranella sp. TaxID=1929291 RepID=UPI0011FD277E|nr:MFS transporter [Reyranella sp.]TAJ39905.1 MAG: MFS transporter [Reyranella sp.]
MTPPNTRRLIAAGTIGNVLEWYDFAIYGYFAATIGRTFFPVESPVAQMLAAFGIFAVGYLMRPLGGIVVGHIADRFGRRAALTFSVMAMAVPTFLVGVLPGYEVLGVAAPVLLTLLRVVQGLSVGGEATTAFVFLVERAGPGRRGAIGALASCGANLGMLSGSAVGALLAAAMPAAALEAWGWRLPFLLGLLVGVAGYFLRRHIVETPRGASAVHGAPPLVETLRHHGRLVARLAGLAAFNAVGFYLAFLYVVSWLQSVDGLAPAQALGFNTVSMLLLLPVMWGMGWLSDRIGRKKLLLAATAAGFVGALPLFWLMHHPQPAMILLGEAGLVLILGTVLGIMPAIMVEATPEGVRCTAISLGYNIAFGIMGGLTPLAAAWLIDRTVMDLSPAFMMMAAAAISFASILTFRESYLDK